MMWIGYGDCIVIDDFVGEVLMVYIQVGDVVVSFGLLLFDDVFVMQVLVSFGMICVVVSWMWVLVFGCFDWLCNVSNEFDSYILFNYGCLVNFNLVVMVVSFVDLVCGVMCVDVIDVVLLFKVIDIYCKVIFIGLGNVLKVESVGGK